MKSNQKDIHIYAYKIADNNEDLFGKIKKALEQVLNRLSKRKKGIIVANNEAEGKVQSISRVRKEDECYLIGYSSLNQAVGPAKGNTKGKIESFQLNQDEGYALMSAALYHPGTGAFLTTNIRGTLNPDDMLRLVLSLDKEAKGVLPCTPIPLIKEEVQVELERSDYCSGVDVTFCPSAMEETFKKEGFSLHNVCGLSGKEVYEGEVRIIFSKARKPSVMEQLKNIAKVFTGRSEEQVKRLRVNVKNNDDKQKKVLDLLNAHVNATVSVPVGADKYIKHDALFRALKNQLHQWEHLYRKDV